MPWPNFYFELPSLEESLSKEILTGGSKVFGGVSSNTVRPVNSYGPWSSKKNKTETENSSQDQVRYKDLVNEKKNFKCQISVALELNKVGISTFIASICKVFLIKVKAEIYVWN